MFSSARRIALSVAAALAGLAAAVSQSHAAFVITLEQVGPDVVADGSGTIDTAGLSATGDDNGSADIEPADGVLTVGPGALTAQETFTGVSGPASFGDGTNPFDGTGTGDIVTIVGVFGAIGLPMSYVSGSALSDTATFSGQTFSSLGVTPGIYTYTFGTAGSADSLTIFAVPEPSTWAMVLAGTVLLGVTLHRRRHLLAS